MSNTIQRYQLTFCAGADGCHERAVFSRDFHSRLATLLEELFTGPDGLAETAGHGKKTHGGFRVAVSDCPNACSRPQIVDIGLIGASEPLVTDAQCKDCGGCVEACKEQAITFWDGVSFPIIDDALCVRCGACIRACPRGTLQELRHGYRILVGGRLGRHPQLGTELSGIYDETESLELVRRIVSWYLANARVGERLADVLNRNVNALKEILKKT
jgi:anaerobic sulfite reductase subunit C